MHQILVDPLLPPSGCILSTVSFILTKVYLPMTNTLQFLGRTLTKLLCLSQLCFHQLNSPKKMVLSQRLPLWWPFPKPGREDKHLPGDWSLAILFQLSAYTSFPPSQRKHNEQQMCFATVYPFWAYFFIKIIILNRAWWKCQICHSVPEYSDYCPLDHHVYLLHQVSHCTADCTILKVSQSRYVGLIDFFFIPYVQSPTP